MIQVLDKGYVRIPPSGTNLVAPIHGDDLSPVNAARASFMKESLELTEADIKLLGFLTREGHTSPYRHATLTVEVKAPFMIARQWFKYRVGWEHGPDIAELVGVAVPEELAPYFWQFLRDAVQWLPLGADQFREFTITARNEASRRYVTLEPEWYIPGPDQWRSAPENRKQGSGPLLPEDVGQELTDALEWEIESGIKAYEFAMKKNVAPEMARGFLPAMYNMYTVWRWTSSLQGFAFFIYQRVIQEGAQDEITDYAKACFHLIKPYFQKSLPQLVDESKLQG